MSDSTAETKRQTAHPHEGTSPSPSKSCGATRWTGQLLVRHRNSKTCAEFCEKQGMVGMRYAPIMIAQGATLPMLAALQLRDYIAIFGMQLNEGMVPHKTMVLVRPSALLHCVWSQPIIAGSDKVSGLQRRRSGECLITTQPGNAGFVTCLKIGAPKRHEEVCLFVQRHVIESILMPCIRNELKRQCRRLCASIACFPCAIHSIALHVSRNSEVVHPCTQEPPTTWQAQALGFEMSFQLLVRSSKPRLYGKKLYKSNI